MPSEVKGQWTLTCLLVFFKEAAPAKQSLWGIESNHRLFFFSSLTSTCICLCAVRERVVFSLKNVLISTTFHKVTHFQRPSYHSWTSGERHFLVARSEVASPQFQCAWLNRVFSNSEADLVTGVAWMWHFCGSDSFISFPVLQSSGLLLMSLRLFSFLDWISFHDFTFLLELSCNLYCKQCFCFLVHKNQQPELLKKEVSTMTHYPLYTTHTHTPSVSWHNYLNQDSSIILNIWQAQGECCFVFGKIDFEKSKWTPLKVAVRQKSTTSSPA